MFTDKETILQCKEDDDDNEVMPELIQEVEKSEEANGKK